MGDSRFQMHHDLNDLEYQVIEMVESIKTIDARIDMYTEFIEANEARERQCEGRTATSYAEMARLRKELFSKNQQDLCNDVTIIHVPEHFGIPLPQLVVQVAEFFGVKLKTSDVVIAMRTGPLGRRPSRPIAVRLASYVHRAALVHASRYKRNYCNPTVIHYQLRIFERLTRKNKLLLEKTRNVAKAAGWLHVWVENAKILVICQVGDDRVHIRQLSDLYDLCESKAPHLLEPTTDEA